MLPLSSSRRSFLQATTSAAVAGGFLSALPVARAAHAGGNDTLKVGLVGCGGRGTGAAVDTLKADANVKLVAMADLFGDRLQDSLKSLKTNGAVASRVDVAAERQFVGFDAFKQLLETNVDVVLLATPPHFRPMHLKAAIEAGKHVFAEKPVAVDAPGIRSVLATCEEAKKKNLSVVSGLCLRNHFGIRELAARIADGAIGKIHTMQASDYRGALWQKPREKDWTDMHYQLRNWYYYTWLSGDFNVEQHIHFLDVCAWLKGNQYPIAAVGMGGRQFRTGAEFGNIYDHHSVVYEYEDGTKFYSFTRQIPNCWGDMSARFVGSDGVAEVREKKDGVNIKGSKQNWVFQGEDNNIYVTEHQEMYAALRAGKVINHGEHMSKSTLLAILGRMATYTGKRITWDQAMNSQEDLSPAKYEWGPAPEAEIAIPGVTKFR